LIAFTASVQIQVNSEVGEILIKNYNLRGDKKKEFKNSSCRFKNLKLNLPRRLIP